MEFARYLFKQGYHQSQVTILVTYREQLLELQKVIFIKIKIYCISVLFIIYSFYKICIHLKCIDYLNIFLIINVTKSYLFVWPIAFVFEVIKKYYK